MISCDDVTQKILKVLPDALVIVTNPRGDDVHFKIEVQDSSFKTLSKIEQHRKVYQILGNNFNQCGQSMHAIELKTSSKEV